MRASTKRILSIGFSLLFLIGALFVVFNLIVGEGKIINEKRALFFSKSNLLRNQDEAVKQVKGLIEQFQNIKRVEETISLALPLEIKAVSALRQVEAIAKISPAVLSSLGFELAPVRTAPKKTIESLVKKSRTLELKLTAEGNYPSLKRFLQLLETTVRVANVRELKFQPAGPRGGVDTLNLIVEMYYQEQ